MEDTDPREEERNLFGVILFYLKKVKEILNQLLHTRWLHVAMPP